MLYCLSYSNLEQTHGIEPRQPEIQSGALPTELCLLLGNSKSRTCLDELCRLTPNRLAIYFHNLCHEDESNTRHLTYKDSALPTELSWHNLAEDVGLEPTELLRPMVFKTTAFAALPIFLFSERTRFELVQHFRVDGLANRWLNHSPIFPFWSMRQDLNLRPLTSKASTLPGCATHRRVIILSCIFFKV